MQSVFNGEFAAFIPAAIVLLIFIGFVLKEIG
jgi:hypothetical protein